MNLAEVLSLATESMTPRAQALFCLAGAERLEICCWAFALESRHDLSPFFKAKDQVLQALVENTQSLVDLDKTWRAVDECVPLSDDYGYPLATQAQAGCRCLLLGIDAFRGDKSSMTEASWALIEGIDNYAFHAWRLRRTGQSAPDDHPLLEREKARQRDDVEELARPGGLESTSLAKWRLVNMLFAIPPAVIGRQVPIDSLGRFRSRRYSNLMGHDVTRAFRHEGERQHLTAITAGELSAVTFVRDYIQLQFDGPTISAFTLPTVVVSNNVFLPPHPGYRDALCALVGRVVAAAYADPGQRLQIDFADGSSLSISLKPEDHVVEEAAVYQDAQTKEWASW